ncbi:MAG: pitrilysin family protein [Parvularculaceae bacterium]|nr:pitrilysin family protein [Parvularculaceae bacterium]
MTPELVTLDNGVRVLIDPMPGLLSAAVGVYARAGTIDERKAENGVAHLLEHMAFKGTRRRTARQIAEEIEAVGGYLNAGTGYTRTGYYARVLSADVALAFDVLADILIDPLFDTGELQKEKEVVLQEIGEAEDQPDDAVMELLQKLSYGDHPLGRPILGTEESVTAQSAASLRAFMTRNYNASDIIVAASGGVDARDVEAIARRLFGEWPNSNAKPARATPCYGGGRRHDARDIEQTHLALAFPGAAVGDDDYFATRVFAEALGGGMSSRIFQSVREERGLAYSVYSFADAYEETGTVGVYAGTDADNAPEAIALIRRDMEGLAASPTAREIERSKAMLKSTILMALENPSARIETAVGQLYAHGRLFAADEIAAKLDAVTADDIARVATKSLVGAASLAVVGPGNFNDLSAALGGNPV